MTQKKKLAVIGASYLQLPLVRKAQEMGLEVHCFAWEDGAVCKDVADYFYPIDVKKKEEILEVCQRVGINGITTIAADLPVPTINYVASRMGLISNSDEYSQTTTNKHMMHRCFLENDIPSPKFTLVDSNGSYHIRDFEFPLIVKPTDRSGSKGVEKVLDPVQLDAAIQRAQDVSFRKEAIIEEFVTGREISVESISFEGKHYILQMTDKVTTGAPYFVELEHHQPSSLPENIQKRVKEIVLHALDALHIQYGAAHSELKITENDDIKVIEIGARMGGDFIGSNLVQLSTGYDFLQGVVEVAIGKFHEPQLTEHNHSGVYFLSEETKRLKPIIEKWKDLPEIIEAKITDQQLHRIECSGDRSGYLMYKSDSRQFFKNNMPIPFNKLFLTGKETHYMYQAVYTGKLSGNGVFTKKCQQFFEEKYGFKKALMTTSGTDALEMAAILCDVQPGDEVIVPSYTFVSTALAFVRQGAKIVFADSRDNNPNIDADKIEALITDKTKVIVPVHYAGVACDMDKIMDIANRHHLFVVEDAAQAIDSYYKGKPLGGIGHFGCFSFYETKNVTAGGEGGLLTVNDERFIRRAEIIWEKGTNRAEFFRGEVDKYRWIDTGSSFLPAEINSAFLWAQLESLDEIQSKRKQLWETYYEQLKPLADKGYFRLPDMPDNATNNAHIFYLLCNSLEERTALIAKLKEDGISAVFHYLSLHSSPYYMDKHDGRELPNCDHYADCLVRLPMFYELKDDEVSYIIDNIYSFYSSR